MKTVTLAEHAGFCFGVGEAVQKASEALTQRKETKDLLYCLGPLIHNKIAIEEFKEKGLVIINDLSEIQEGSSVLIRAHGEPPETFDTAKKMNLNLIDATCPFVAKIHKLVSNATKEGRQIVIVGDPKHPEVKSIFGWALGKAFVIYNREDADRFKNILRGASVSIVAQTTITKERFDLCVESIKQYTADVIVYDTICQATKERQDAAFALAKKSDLMIVIGDKTSSNSQKLVEICKKACQNVHFIENSQDLALQEMKKYCKIGVAASASAPERIIKEVIATMSENFTKDLQTEEVNEMSAFMDEIEKSLRLPSRGEVITGEAVQVTKDYIVVNLGCKKDGILPKSEMVLEDDQELTALFKEGDEIQAKVIKNDDGDGNILLSKKKLQSGENWDEINAALDSKEVVNATIVKEVKGGVIAIYKEVSGFIPMSQLADHYVESAAEYVGKTLPVKVTRVDQRRNKAVFSHKAFLNEEKYKKIAEIWKTLNIGDVVEGKVMRFTDYGAFVDIGGLDGLLHISEISWGKLKHPQEALAIGQLVNVKILSMNEEKGKISLGLKQNNPEPWSVIDDKYQEGQVIEGRVVQIKEYGAFVELEPGLDGLVHISEVAHKRVNKISEELEIGQLVQAKVLEIDRERRRISLSIKETQEATYVEEGSEPVPAGEEEVLEAQSEEEFVAEETVVVTPEAAAEHDEYLGKADSKGAEDVSTPALKSMKKAELAAFAEEHNIELPAKTTIAEMITIIESALE
ncbi:MAG: bifunctional 4-hydroxy-3-methylbut-2-enyl diphosphate reductase/30S ribosomal protein S1 [Clostridia bacterium]|nr:bifunctional 4-hydroxy-3-methylbut-2-enyl diphosphate reductase/30S ribosomal protein S1 [Clostridia bacterium]